MRINSAGNAYVGVGVPHPLFPDYQRSFSRHDLHLTVNDFSTIDIKIIGVDSSQWGNKIPEKDKFAVMGLRDYFNIISPEIIFPELVLEVPQDQRALTQFQRDMLHASSMQEMVKLPDFWRGMTLVKRNDYVPKKREVTFIDKDGNSKRKFIEAPRKILGDLHLLYGDTDERFKHISIDSHIFTGKCDLRLVSYSGQNKMAGEIEKSENFRKLYTEYNHDGTLNFPVQLLGIKVCQNFMAQVEGNYKDLGHLGFAIDKISKKLGIEYYEFIAKVFGDKNVTSVNEATQIILEFSKDFKNIDMRTMWAVNDVMQEIDSIRRFGLISTSKFLELTEIIKQNPRLMAAVKSDVRDILFDLKDRKATKVRIQEQNVDGTFSGSMYMNRLFIIAEKISKLRLVR